MVAVQQVRGGKVCTTKVEKGKNHEQFRRTESEEKRAWAKDK